MAYVPKMTHAQRHARRLALIEEVRRGRLMTEVAAEAGVSVGLLRKECARVGVAQPQYQVLPNTYTIIAALLNTGDTLTAIALRFGISKERVRQIYQRCIDAGIAVARRRQNGGRNRS